MDYAKAFARALQALKDEWRYRVFVDIRRECRCAALRTGGCNGQLSCGAPTTIWAWVSTQPCWLPCIAAFDPTGGGSGGTGNISGATHHDVELEAELAGCMATRRRWSSPLPTLPTTRRWPL